MYKYKEYAAAKNLENAIRILISKPKLKIDVNKIISLNKLIEGGAPIFIILKINQKIDILGKTESKPFTK